ncbi:MAG: PIN domain-containing protein [Microbacteriaceae bacterium]|nr:PIN domain-containing protein [Microbacteriaceae bacterium]
MIVADASVIIAFLDSTDSHHQRARELVLQASDGILMHDVTLAEVLVAPARLGRAQEVFTGLESLGVAAFDGVPGEALLLAELRAGTTLRMPDCCVLLTAIVTSAPLATFDKQLSASAVDRGLNVLGV